MNKKLIFIVLLETIAFFALINSDLNSGTLSLVGIYGAIFLIVFTIIHLIHAPLQRSENQESEDGQNSKRPWLTVSILAIALMIATCGLLGSGA